MPDNAEVIVAGVPSYFHTVPEVHRYIEILDSVDYLRPTFDISFPSTPYVYLRLSTWSHRSPLIQQLPRHQKDPWWWKSRMLCSPKPDFGLILAAPKARMAHYARPGLLARSSKPVLFIHREWLRNIKLGNFSQDYLFAQYLSSDAQTALGSAQESGNFYRYSFSMRRPLTDIPPCGSQGIWSKFFLTHLANATLGHGGATDFS